MSYDFQSTSYQHVLHSLSFPYDSAEFGNSGAKVCSILRLCVFVVVWGPRDVHDFQVHDPTYSSIKKSE
jgi:hypothetical protein